MVFLSVERLRFPARGRAGGLDGATGHIALDGRAQLGKGVLRIRPGQELLFDTPGGGGFGSAHLRNPLALERDLQEGFVTDASAYLEESGNDPTG